MDEIIYKLSNCEIMRLDVDDEHYYYGGKPDSKDPKEYYLSVTQVIGIGGPVPEGLREWWRATGYEESKERLQFTGERGKKLHNALDELMQRNELNLKRDYTTQYEKDAIATFVRMMRFLNPGKYSTELVVADPDLRVAGTLDFKGFVDEWRLECLLDPNKYLDMDSDSLQLKQKWLDLPDNKKRVHIIIDWKFTSVNAYSHKVQVTAYKTMNNKTRKGKPVSRAFTWRYSSRHKFGFDFSESLLDYQSFKRIYNTTIEYLGEFPLPPTIKKFPETVRLYEPTPMRLGSVSLSPSTSNLESNKFIKEKNNMLTLQQLKDMEPDTIFATGTTTDDSDGVNLANTGQKIRWVACRGDIHDWAIYAQDESWDEQRVKEMGDKITSKNNIKKLVPCSDEAFAMYRY